MMPLDGTSSAQVDPQDIRARRAAFNPPDPAHRETLGAQVFFFNCLTFPTIGVTLDHIEALSTCGPCFITMV